jgi:hypothetical protein
MRLHLIVAAYMNHGSLAGVQTTPRGIAMSAADFPNRILFIFRRMMAARADPRASLANNPCQGIPSQSAVLRYKFVAL